MEFVKQDPLQARRQSLRWVSALGAWNKRFKELKSSDTPLLIIQGAKDTTVDVRDNLRILKHKFPNAVIEKFEGLGHQLMNESLPGRRKVLNCVHDYFDEQSKAPAP